MNPTTGIKSVLLCLSAAAVLTQGCNSNEDAKAAATAAEAPKVPVITIKAENATITKVYSSSIEGQTNVEIRPQVSGVLQKIFVDEGAYVSAGQSLFFIDDKIYREQLNTALGNLHNAEAGMETARINLDKTNTLVSNKVSSEVNLQTAKAAFHGAKAVVEQATAAVENARINMGYCTVKAPVSGYIGRIPFKLGSLVAPTTPQALTMLSDIHNVYAYFSMGEAEFVNFEHDYSGNSVQQMLGKVPPVKLQLADGSTYSEKGRISAVEGQFDRTTGSISLRATFPNSKSQLRTGNTGKVLIDQQMENVVLLPIAATIEVQNVIYTFKVDNSNKVTQTPVTTAGKTGTSYIIASGLKAGDRIVSQGFERLQNGMAIVPEAAK